MSIGGDELGAFADLARALGLLRNDELSGAWFQDPMGDASTSDKRGLATILFDDDQREALLDFVDDVLGPPDQSRTGDEVWVPLFANDDPDVTIYAVIRELPGVVHVGVGVEHTAGTGAPAVASRLKVPVFQFDRSGAPDPVGGGSVPDWLVLGRAGGVIEITADVTVSTAPPVPGEAHIGGIAATIGIPTSALDDLAFALTLRDVQLPGATAPRTFSLDATSLEELGTDVFDLIVGLVRAQADALNIADPVLRPFAALTGMLGLRDVAGLPPLPLADVPSLGVGAIVAWVEQVLNDGTARDAWLGQVGLLIGATLDAANDAVTIAIGPLQLDLGVRVTAGTGGHPVVVPWLSLDYEIRAGAKVSLVVDLLNADTGTGQVSALPSLRAEAVFGADAGGGALLTGDPGVASVHVGIALTGLRTPKFTLTLHDATLAGRSYPVLDLSTPQAALAAANDAIDAALVAALQALGEAGAVVAELIGLDPPSGVGGTDATALLADPLGELAAYWRRLAGDGPAMALVLGRLRRLVLDAADVAVPGTGTAIDPWRIELFDAAALVVSLDGDRLVVAFAVTVDSPPLGDVVATVELAAALATVDLVARTATFLSRGAGTIVVHRADDAPVRLTLDRLALEGRSIGLELAWMPSTGFTVRPVAVGLAVEIAAAPGPAGASGASRVELALPVIDATGALVFTPDWDGIERAVASLLRELRSPVVDALVGLVGWDRLASPRLSLGDLLASPGDALEGWLADLVLDCENVRTVLAPIAALLSGFRITQVIGSGSQRSPYRAPLAGEPLAPALVAWLDPGCPPPPTRVGLALDRLTNADTAPEPGEIVALLTDAAYHLPDIADLLVSRDSLAAGFTTLIDRWTATDGLVAEPAVVPDGVTTVSFDGVSYDELAALGAAGGLIGDLFDPVPAAVVHVTAEAWVGADWPGVTVLDASGDAAPAAIPAASNGTWLVKLPSLADAAAARPDRGGVGEQAERLAAVLSSRTSAIALVGYGTAGAAVVRVASSATAVDKVATVGSPWSGLSVESLRGGLSGDALRLLELIDRADPTPWSQPLLAREATPLERARRLVRRSASAAAGEEFPSVGVEPLRTGVAYVAAFGALSADDLAFGLAAFVGDGVDARHDAAVTAAGGPMADTVHTALHLGVDVPVIDLDLAGLLVGAGATLELLTVTRSGGGLEFDTTRRLHVNLHLGVHDGWLVGGPGAASTEFEVRWMAAHVTVPLDGGAAGPGGVIDPGSTEFVLHEAAAFGIERERWVVNADGTGLDATAVLPEARVLLGQVVSRLLGASSALADLFSVIGIVSNGGLDPTGFDAFVHDTAVTVRTSLAEHAADLASSLRSLTGATGTGATATWSVGDLSVSIDLGAPALALSSRVDAADGVAAVDLAVALSPAGVTASAALGTLDDDAGGVRLVGEIGAGGAAATLALEWQGPNGATPRRIPLAPSPDGAALTDFAVTAVPAVVTHALGRWARDQLGTDSRQLLDAVLDDLGLLGAVRENGERALVVPFGLFTDPGGWLAAGAAAWRTDPVGRAIALADALAAVIAPGRGTASNWPLVPGLAIGYRSVGGRLELTAEIEIDVTVDATQVTTTVVAGFALSPSAAPAIVLDASVSIDGRGVHLGLAPALRLDLTRPSPAAPIPLYPASGGIGSVVSAVGAMVLPPVLDAVRGHRDDATASVLRDVARAVNEVVTALDLLEADVVSGARLELFAADPAAWTVARLPAIAAGGLAQLAGALDPAGALVAVVPSPPTTTKLAFGAGRAISVLFEAGADPAITLSASVDIPDVGHLAIEALRLSASGLQVSALIGPFPLDLGALVLRPLVALRAGVSSAGFSRMVSVGLGLDDTGERSVEVRWGLDAQPPSLVAVTRAVTGETLGSATDAALGLLSIGVSLATGVALDALGPVISSRATAALQGVLFTDVASSTDVDAAFFTDLLDADALVDRVKRLAWNLATTAPISITIDSIVTVGLVADDAGGGDKRLGVNLSLAAGKRFAFPVGGDLKVEMEVDATWVDPPEPAGLSIFVLEGRVASNGNVSLDLVPSVVVAGIGLRFTKTSGPLLDLGGIALDGIGISLYGEASPDGAGGGARLMLEGLAFAPSAGGGTNPVANSIMNDAGEAGSANRPAFSPSVAVQKHPADALKFSVRAGHPPGPWWVVVQRQLGPLYVERVGFDSVETAGTVTRITLLFDGGVSLFGLTAQVDQLTLSWLGGDVFDISSWSVDLMGLAVSADMAGVSLSGGLLKTVDNGVTSYVGMLLGRFGIYGLSVFGGYADDNGSPSFFVFGAINGPIGGPPAFFLTGIGGGLGINRGLVIPTDISQFGEYPFIKALDPAAQPSTDPMGELRQLTEYFPPQSGNFWFAAGISFNSFALVDGIAVVAVSFGEGLEISLLGLARMALPRPQAALVSIELALVARFSTVEGVFMIQAQLTENSWLLYEDVRLTGGFAFAIWWKGPLAGQFVLSIGGYHPDFHRDGYPEVPRLGLVWQVTDDIVIKGGSYFALTSEALMAGVDVEVSADFGWAWAKLTFGAHGIVYFDPFWFEVSAYVRISAGVEIDTWLGTVGFSISLGAQLKVWGPDFSGEAEIEVGPCSFTVSFGSDRTIAPEILDWVPFVAKYLEDAGGGKARALSAITGRGTLPAATGGNTGAPSSDGSAARPYEVFAEFELAIVTSVPANKFVLPGGPEIPVTVRSSNGATASLGISPMKLSNLSSALSVQLHRLDETTNQWVAQFGSLTKLAANLRAAVPDPAGSTIGTDAYPIGAWGAPGPDVPVKPLPAGDVLFAANRLQLVAKADTLTVGPEIDYYQVESGRRPLPLQATGNNRVVIRTVASNVDVATPTTAVGALNDAASVLFAGRDGELPDGLLATGTRSGVDRASFFGQRSAPPLFGTLADGLAVANPDDGAASRGPLPPTKKAPPVRTPFVAGYLTAGAGAVKRAAATTVADQRLKRRAAPSLDSVQARLGRVLPVQMGLSTVPATVVDGSKTLIAQASTLVPHTAATGATASTVAGPVGHGELQNVVTGLAKTARTSRSRETAGLVRSGDTVVLQAPDASIDTDERARFRPKLQVKGTARVTVLGGNGAPLVDDYVRDATVVMPAGFAAVVAQADGHDVAASEVAGWHERSRVAQIGSNTLLAPGAVVTVTGSGSAVRNLGWIAAGDVVRGAAAVTTRFTKAVRTVAVALTGTDVARFDPLALELAGAELTAADPIAVQIGSTCVLVYAVTPSPSAEPVVVRVRAGADWGVAGVLGGDLTADELARRSATRGLGAVVAKTLATSGPGAAFTWVAPAAPTPSEPSPPVPPTTGPRPRRVEPLPVGPRGQAEKAPAKKAPAKKAPAKKAPAKKAPAKKAAGTAQRREGGTRGRR
ncbi:MAG: DUF6603 domain-containing protein [Acidimicrobiia bacterium]